MQRSCLTMCWLRDLRIEREIGLNNGKPFDHLIRQHALDCLKHSGQTGDFMAAKSSNPAFDAPQVWSRPRRMQDWRKPDNSWPKHGYNPVPPDEVFWIPDLDTSCHRDFCVGNTNTALASLQAVTQGVHASLHALRMGVFPISKPRPSSSGGMFSSCITRYNAGISRALL